MNNKTILKSLLIWLSITPLAIINGGLRQYVLFPMLGAAAYPVSGIILTLCIFIVAYVFIPRLGKASRQTYARMGLTWVVATLVFETTLGIVAGTPVSEILEAYDITTGNLWLLIVIFMGFVPAIVARMKKLAVEEL
jgi:hypothetical protein